jgi:hypothetical protein
VSEVRDEDRNDVLTTAAIIGAFPSADDQTIVEQLVTHGYERLKAELLLVFVPLGLARAVIARIAVARPIKLSGTAQIVDYVSNQTFRVRLADVPEFETARQLGEETFHTGIIPREQLSAASGFSIELILINKALNEGVSISGSVLAPPHLLRLAETPGFEEWYRDL